mgnify:CR=1 FL=1|jgi:hypothetical protein
MTHAADPAKRCQFLNQKRLDLDGKLRGVWCTNEATVHQSKNGRSYDFCTVHSYTVERFSS